MKWVIILALLIAAFGPVLWLLPKPQDRRLSRLRMAARQKGISVQLARLPDPQPDAQDRVSSGGVVRSPVIRCAGYRLFARRPVPEFKSWRIERDDPEAEVRLGESWCDLPTDWIAVEVDAKGVCLYWREEVTDESLQPRLDTVFRLLKGLLALHLENVEHPANGQLEA